MIYMPQMIYYGLMCSRLTIMIHRKFKNKQDRFSKTVGAILAETFMMGLLYTGGFFK